MRNKTTKTQNMNRRKTVLCMLLISMFKMAVSQGTFSFTGSNIGLTYTLAPERGFKNAAGGYGYHTTGINTKLRLFGKHVTGATGFYDVFLQGNLQATTASFGFLKNDREFLGGSLGVGMAMFNGHKNFYLVDFSAGASAEKTIIDRGDTRYRMSGAFIVNHLHSTTTIYQYGLALTYAYGRPLVLPVIGIRTKLSTNWTFSTILPVEASFTDKLSNKLRLAFSIRPSGNRFQFANEGNFTSPSKDVFLQLREFLVGAALHYTSGHDFTFSAETGLLVGGSLKFAEQDDTKSTVYEMGVKPGALFRLSARYRLPRKSIAGGKPLNDLLNPTGN